MSIKINFDSTHNPEPPTLVLAKRNGEKMGALSAYNIVVKDSLTDASEIQFEMYKYLSDGITLTNLWYSVIDFRLIWCKEWDMWFELTVEFDETTETHKTISCTQLGQAELSQINLYDIHINDEDDILRDDYEIPTVFYNPEHPEASLLNRITEHAPHYTIRHVDNNLMNIQRTFTFDSESILDAFNEIAEEIECIFFLPSESNEDGGINRVIDVYDLDSVCTACGHRGDFTTVCPECGCTDINEGYGNDTTIFISAEELASEIQFSTDTDSVKNCFKLEGGDDLMTATIRNCNPNGSDRIWYITEQSKADMTNELLQGLADYDSLYEYYQSDYIMAIPTDMIYAYNDLVEKYREYNPDIETIPLQIQGYPALMEAYYNTIDFGLYLQSVLMPDASMSDTTAKQEAAKLTAYAMGDIAVSNTGSISTATANNAVLAMAKVIVDSRYQVKVNEGNLDWLTWTGNFKVTNYSDEDDTAISSTISLTITDDYEEYLRQMIEKELNSDEVNDMSIVALFNMDYDDFCNELKKYCLDSLSAFWDAGQACLDILIEQGIADKETWGSDEAGAESNLYEILYLPYYEKQAAIEYEMRLREDEISIILGTYDEDGLVDEEGMQTYLISERNKIQKALSFEDYLGEDLWLEFSAFRREDKFSNANYISDGLDNAELFSRAWEFLGIAQEEIYKSAELQHSISTDLKNLLVIDKFEPLIDKFECGNWLRVKTDDSVYKLRLIVYEIEYDSIERISVDFSDVMKTLDGLSDKQDLISKMGSIASSYDTVEHQASQGSSANGILDGWSLWGLDVDNVKLVQSADNETQSWDEHGMLFRKYDPITESYSDEQLKIIHSTMVITDDNWETVKTAVGGFYYYDPADNYQLKYAYGVNGEVLVGQLILGESLGIYNESGSLKFDKNGLSITNGTNTFTVDPNGEQLLVLSKGNTQLFYVDSDGNATFSGNLDAATGTFYGKLSATNGTNTFTVDPDNDQLLVLSKGSTQIFYVDKDGNATFSGALNAATGTFNGKLSVTNGTNTFTVDPDSDQLVTLLKGSTDVFYVDSDGNVNILGAVTTVNGDYKTAMLGGSVRLYYDDTHYGSVLASKKYYSESRGISLQANYNADYIGFTQGTLEDYANIYYEINLGDSLDNSTQRHMFFDDVWFDDKVYHNIDIYSPAYSIITPSYDVYWGMWFSNSTATGGLHINGVSNGTKDLYLGTSGGNVYYCSTDEIYHPMLVFKCGYCSITPSAANTPTGYVVTFSNAFDGTPNVFVTPYSSQPYNAVLGVSVGSVSSTGMTIYITKTNTESTNVDWMAVR